MATGKTLGRYTKIHIDGIDQSDAEVMRPDAIDETASEERILGGSHPLEQFFANILARLVGDFRAAQSLRRERLAGFDIVQNTFRRSRDEEHLANLIEVVVIGWHRQRLFALGVLGVGDFLHLG